MKTKFNHVTRKAIILAISAFSFVVGGIAFAGPAPETVTLPTASIDTSVPIAMIVQQPVMVSQITGAFNYVGFQGDFTFNENVITFANPQVSQAGLTSGAWNVSGNILPGPGPIRVLRVSAFSLDFTPLSGSGVLYNLNILRVAQSGGVSTALTWQPDPDSFFFIDDSLGVHIPTQLPGLITITGPTPTPCPACTPTPTPTGTPTPTPTASPTPTPSLTPTPTPTPTPTMTPAVTPTATPSCSPSVVLSQGFDDITTLVPGGWFMQNNSQPGPGTTNWFQGNTAVFAAQGGAGSSYIGTNFNNGTGTATLSNWLLTPPLTLQNGTVLSFWTRTTDTPAFPDRLQVRMSTNGASTNVGTTATSVGDFTSLLLDINPTYTTSGYPNVWTQFNVTVSGVASPTQGRLALRYFVENGGPSGVNSDYIGVDTLSITGGCGGPTPTPGTPTPTPTTPTPTPTTPTPTPSGSCPPTITQSSSQTITTGNSAGCTQTGTGFNTDNSYWRAFPMTTLVGPTNGYSITSVSFGIESANATAADQPINVRLYVQNGTPFPGGTRTQIGTATTNVADQTGTIVQVPITAFVPAGTNELIMEVNSPDGRTLMNMFFIGSNAAPQTGPSYISAVDCGITTPTDVSAIGFPNMHMVFNVNGTCIPGTPTPTPTASPTPTPVVTPTGTPPVMTPTPTPVGSVTPTPVPTTPPPTPTSTPGGSVTPTPAPTATPGTEAINMSTRMRVDVGNGVAIGGFIVTGNQPKNVIIRAIGPSLTQFGITDALADPVLELHGDVPFVTITNNNWRDDQEQQIIDTGIPPTNDLESAIVATLNPGSYTAVVKGLGNTAGVGLVEIYDLNPESGSKLANISTRAIVNTGNDIVIAGFVLSSGPNMDPVIVRGIGPSLADIFPGEMVLADPTLELRDSNGELIIGNNNWADDPTQAALLQAANLAPTNAAEAGLVAMLPSGAYTALLAGANNGTGIGVVEIYDNPASGPTPTPGPSGTPGPPTPTPQPTATPCSSCSPTPTPVPTTPPPPTPTPTPGGGGTCVEAFDSVAAPGLPAGWVASNPDPGDGVVFVTVTAPNDTAPNSAFIPDQDGISDKVLDSKPVNIQTANSVMTFKNNFNSEFSDGVFWDGSVLEVSTPSISGGDFLDITDSHVGGTITAGGYTGEISGDASNPLSGRMAWSGSSSGFITTTINMGPSLAGQTVTLRFRFGSDEAVAAPGWWVDTISITDATCP